MCPSAVLGSGTTVPILELSEAWRQSEACWFAARGRSVSSELTGSELATPGVPEVLDKLTCDRSGA